MAWSSGGWVVHRNLGWQSWVRVPAVSSPAIFSYFFPHCIAYFFGDADMRNPNGTMLLLCHSLSCDVFLLFHPLSLGFPALSRSWPFLHACYGTHAMGVLMQCKADCKLNFWSVSPCSRSNNHNVCVEGKLTGNWDHWVSALTTIWQDMTGALAKF